MSSYLYIYSHFCVLMNRRTRRSKRTDTLFPCTTLFRTGFEKLSAMPRKMFQSLRAPHTGSMAAVSGWMKGCITVVLRSFFSYQVAVGRKMSEKSPVVFPRKLMVTLRSSRSDERRVGKECGSRGRLGRSPYH